MTAEHPLGYGVHITSIGPVVEPEPDVSSEARMHTLDASCWCHPKVETIAPKSRAVIHEDDPTTSPEPPEDPT